MFYIIILMEEGICEFYGLGVAAETTKSPLIRF